jgi:UDP-N-acetylmuramate--alanine ligase
LLIENSNTKIHFIGIGGIGMSALAEVSLQLEFKVSGSDMANSPNVEKLAKLGAKTYIGHSEKNISEVNVIVYSSAIDPENPEFSYALKNNIPIMKRAELLADLMRLKQGIAIAGTHGKTTTTSIVTSILKASDRDPTYIIGGIVKNLGGHAFVGKGDHIVAEADESDGSFLLLNPVYSIITNIDNDHLDYYKTVENLHDSFNVFANKIPFYGVCALNADDKVLKKIAARMKKPFVTFGIDEDKVHVNYRATDLKFEKSGVSFDVSHDGKVVDRFFISTPGKHNVLNTLGAISICHSLGLSFVEIKNSLKSFTGVGRRYQRVYEESGFQIIDDYGHHPTEIIQTIKTAKKDRPESKLVVLFEPHRFTRTKACWNEFLHSFNDADEVLMAPIYPASEQEIAGISSSNLTNDINKLHPSLATSFEDWDIIKNKIEELKKENATLLVLGAGSVGRKVKSLVDSKQ